MGPKLNRCTDIQNLEEMRERRISLFKKRIYKGRLNWFFKSLVLSWWVEHNFLTGKKQWCDRKGRRPVSGYTQLFCKFTLRIMQQTLKDGF
jgi:hypothetical protein